MFKRRLSLALLGSVLSTASFAGWQATIERDRWGIPHVYGETDADAAYGLGYAQAEDTWSVLESSLPYYRGNAGALFGPDAAKTDFLVHWLGLWPDIEARYQTDLAPATRAYIEAFAAGITDFARAHPERVQHDILPITGQDIVAAHMLRHPMFYGFDAEIKNLLAGPPKLSAIPGSVERDGQPIGSNAIAVGPTRSDDGSTMLVINSHQPLTGPVAWYEAHIESGQGLNVMGGLFPGAPAVGVGFTPTTAWGATVNKPDLVDVYQLTLNPENPDQYWLDGQWHKLERWDIELDVLIWGFIPWSVTETGYRSAHGPVLKTEHGAYAVRYAGMGELRQIEQWLAMNRAHDFSSWKEAIGLNHIPSFNFVYAGQAGNIYFIHNAQMPERAPGWQWRLALPGDQSDVIWQRYLPVNTLPQILNPQSGFLLSTNQTPFNITEVESNVDAADYPIEAGWQTRMTNRAVRGLELFAAHPKVSRDDLLTIKHDNRYSPSYRGMAYLQQVLQVTTNDDQLKQAQAIIANWNGATDKANRGAPLGVCVLRAEWRAESAGTALPSAQDTLELCVDEVLSLKNRLDPTWGEVNRHGRGDTHVALAGGPDTLRAAYASEIQDDHRRVTAGDGLYYLVSWDANGKQSVVGVHQYGNHADLEDHPHYLDQLEDYANETLHPALFDREQRAPWVERRYTVSSETLSREKP